MKLGLALPSFVDDPDIPITVARTAEAAGLDGVFVYDHLWRDRPPPRRPAFECFGLLGAIAVETERIHVGTLVARATLRPAAVLAQGFASVHRVSGGRLIAGIGAGDSESRAENESFGLTFGSMASRVGALADAVAAARGNGYPVWVGGKATMVRETCVLADAWNTWGDTPEEFSDRGALVRELAPATALTWGGLVLCGRDDAHVGAKAARFSPGPHVIAGTPAQVASRLCEYADRGAAWAVVAPLDASDPENAAILGEVVAPLVR